MIELNVALFGYDKQYSRQVSMFTISLCTSVITIL